MENIEECIEYIIPDTMVEIQDVLYQFEQLKEARGHAKSGKEVFTTGRSQRIKSPQDTDFLKRQKAEAVRRLRLMGALEEHIRDFEQNDKVYMTVTWDDWAPVLSPEEEEMISYLQDSLNRMVYLVIRTRIDDWHEMNTFFYVGRQEEKWPDEIAYSDIGMALAVAVDLRNGTLLSTGFVGFHRYPTGTISRMR